MRLLTGADIIDFYNGRCDILVLAADGEFAHIDRDSVTSSSYDDGRATAYDCVTTEDGDEVQVLLERETIADGDWFPDALDSKGDLTPSVADEMAAIINNDANLPTVIAVRQFKDATEAWAEAAAAADARAMDRARAAADVVALCGGNQSMAARTLHLDQSTVNKLVKKARAAA